jgi:hypothetical protein
MRTRGVLSTAHRASLREHRAMYQSRLRTVHSRRHDARSVCLLEHSWLPAFRTPTLCCRSAVGQSRCFASTVSIVHQSVSFIGRTTNLVTDFGCKPKCDQSRCSGRRRGCGTRAAWGPVGYSSADMALLDSGKGYRVDSWLSGLISWASHLSRYTPKTRTRDVTSYNYGL